MEPAAEAKRLLDSIAFTPRAAGSADEQRAFGLCSSFLEALGYSVRREEFTFSAFPGALATPAVGLASCAMFAVVCLFAATGRIQQAWLALVLHAGAVAVLALSGARRGVLSLPIMRRTSSNLVAQRGTEEPDVWLMAHLDSKSQPVSIVVRAAGVALAALSYALLVVLLILATTGRTLTPAFCVVAVAGIAGSGALALSFVGNRSRGALDNASGVVSTLLAARRLAAVGENRVGIVLTSAEELGLAGARAWCGNRTRRSVINCDSVDDEGEFLCIVGRSEGGAAHFALKHACEERETRLAETRMLIGILVDSVALGSQKWDSITLCRGTLRSLARIHTASDTAERLSGTGIVLASEILQLASLNVLNSLERS